MRGIDWWAALAVLVSLVGLGLTLAGWGDVGVSVGLLGLTLAVLGAGARR